jgi:hypothetical protein
MSITVGNCFGCGAALAGRQRKWCGDTCAVAEARRVRLESIFNITPEEYDEILLAQDGRCGICEKPPKPGKRLAVDHDHKTGIIRGLLCFYCNKRVLGARSADVLIKTAAYVFEQPARRVIGARIAPGRPKKRRKRKTKRRKKAA